MFIRCLIVVCALGAFSLSVQDQGRVSVGAEAHAATLVKTTQGSFVAALTKAKLLRALDFVAADDKMGFARYLAENIDVFIMKSGVRVYVEDATFFTGMIKIRPVGETVSFWTVAEAVH